MGLARLNVVMPTPCFSARAVPFLDAFAANCPPLNHLDRSGFIVKALGFFSVFMSSLLGRKRPL